MIYNKIIKPLLFSLNIEQARLLAIWMLRFVGAIPFGKRALKRCFAAHDPSLEREVFGIKFQNPIGLAAGFDNNAEVIEEMGALGFGFVEVGSITTQEQEGNPKPRIFRLGKDAIIERLGGENRGWAKCINSLRSHKKGVVVGCNISINSFIALELAPREYLKCFRNLYQYTDYFTLCLPANSIEGDAAAFEVERVRSIITPLFDFRRGQSDYRPILIKISPDLSDEHIDQITDLMIETPLDGIVAVSGTNSREELDIDTLAAQRIGRGRIGGKPLRKRALEVVKRVHRRSGGAYPIIGVGGISSASDAKEMLDAGASLVQLYSGLIYQGPSVAGDICRELSSDNPKEQ